MPVDSPPTTGSFGNISLVVLPSVPADLSSIALSAIAAGENISCHHFGDWLPTATIEKVTAKRKMCETKAGQRLGVTTHETPAFQYSYLPQAVGTAGAPGNEAYEAMPEGAVVVALQRLGKGGKTDLTAGDKYRAFVLQLGPQVPGVSQEDAAGDFVINQETAFASGYDGPIDGVVAA